MKTNVSKQIWGDYYGSLVSNLIFNLITWRNWHTATTSYSNMPLLFNNHFLILLRSHFNSKGTISIIIFMISPIEPANCFGKIMKNFYQAYLEQDKKKMQDILSFLSNNDISFLHLSKMIDLMKTILIYLHSTRLQVLKILFYLFSYLESYQ